MQGHLQCHHLRFRLLLCQRRVQPEVQQAVKGVPPDQAPAAKGPPVPKIGGTPTVQGPPVRPSSDSAVMAKAGTTDPQAKGSLQGQFPTPAESVGKSAPVKKPPPTGKPKPRASSLSLKGSLCLRVQHNRTWNGSQRNIDCFPEGGHQVKP